MSSHHFLEPDERRQHPRLNRDEKLFLQITRCDSAPELVDTTVLCSTRDVSASGLRLSVEKPIDEGVELDLWVNVDGHGGKFYLAGRVQWSSDIDDEHCVGISVIERSNTDFLLWSELFI